MTEFVRVAACLECKVKPVLSRGLCGSCYKSVSRSGDLGLYPTQSFLDNPEMYIRWAFEHNPDLIGDIAIEYGHSVNW